MNEWRITSTERAWPIIRCDLSNSWRDEMLSAGDSVIVYRVNVWTLAQAGIRRLIEHDQWRHPLMSAGISAHFNPDDTAEIRRIRDAVHALDENSDPRRWWWAAIGVTASLTAVFAVASFGQAVWAGDDLGNSATATNLRIGWAIGVIVLFQLVLAYSRQVAMSRDLHRQTEDLREQTKLLRAVVAEVEATRDDMHTVGRHLHDLARIVTDLLEQVEVQQKALAEEHERALLSQHDFAEEHIRVLAALRDETRNAVKVALVAVGELVRTSDPVIHGGEGGSNNDEAVNGKGLGPLAIETLRQMSRDVYGLDP